MGNVMDQAEGLRRLMLFSRARTVALVAGTRGAGVTRCVVNLARALVSKGRRVLVVDENVSNQSIPRLLGMRARYDLKHVIGGDCELEQALLHCPDGISVLPAARAAQALPRLDSYSEERAIACFAQLDRRADIVLLDARSDAHAPTPFSTAVQEVIVVVSPGPSSIKGGYTMVKRMHRCHGRRRFHILVNRSRVDGIADQVFRNMAQAAARHLNVALNFMGTIPHDAELDASAGAATACRNAMTRSFSQHAETVLRWNAPHDDVSRLDSFMQRAIYESRLTAAGAGA